MKLAALHPLATRLFAGIVYGYMRLVGITNRLTVSGTSTWNDEVLQGRNICAFWHNRMFYSVYYYCVVVKSAPPASILISMSRDGDYGAALVKVLRQETVRGSSSRGGRRAIRQLGQCLQQGYNIALTPDGPRGPAEQVQMGIIRLAQMTGSPILPISYDASRKRIFKKSWDHFILPLPFGRIHLAFGAPIRVKPQARGPALEKARQELERALLDLDEHCQRQVCLTHQA